MAVNIGQAQFQIAVDARGANISLKQLNQQFNNLQQNVVQTSKATTKQNQGLKTQQKQYASLGATIKEVGRLASAAFAIRASNFLAGKLVGIIKQYTLLAARVENLGTVLNNVGKNANLSSAEIAGLTINVQSLGITLRQTRQSIALMAQANLDLTQSAKLARIAQNAAVIAGVNSSDAFERLITAISRNDVRLLRQLGIVINLNAVYAEYKERTGKSAQTLGTVEKRTLLLNEVMKQGARIAGSYEAALQDVFKRFTSLDRKIEETQRLLGKQFIPVFEVLVDGLDSLFNFLQKNNKEAAILRANLAGWAVALAGLGAGLSIMISLGAAVAAFSAAMAALGGAGGPLLIAIGVIGILTGSYIANTLAVKGNIEAIKQQQEQYAVGVGAISRLRAQIEELNTLRGAAPDTEEFNRAIELIDELKSEIPSLAKEFDKATLSIDPAAEAMAALNKEFKGFIENKTIEENIKAAEDSIERLEANTRRIFVDTASKVGGVWRVFGDGVVDEIRRQEKEVARMREKYGHETNKFHRSSLVDAELLLGHLKNQFQELFGAVGKTTEENLDIIGRRFDALIRSGANLREELAKLGVNIDNLDPTTRQAIDRFDEVNKVFRSLRETKTAQRIRDIESTLTSLNEAEKAANELIKENIELREDQVEGTIGGIYEEQAEALTKITAGISALNELELERNIILEKQKAELQRITEEKIKVNAILDDDKSKQKLLADLERRRARVQLDTSREQLDVETKIKTILEGREAAQDNITMLTKERVDELKKTVAERSAERTGTKDLVKFEEELNELAEARVASNEAATRALKELATQARVIALEPKIVKQFEALKLDPKDLNLDQIIEVNEKLDKPSERIRFIAERSKELFTALRNESGLIEHLSEKVRAEREEFLKSEFLESLEKQVKLINEIRSMKGLPLIKDMKEINKELKQNEKSFDQFIRKFEGDIAAKGAPAIRRMSEQFNEFRNQLKRVQREQDIQKLLSVFNQAIQKQVQTSIDTVTRLDKKLKEVQKEAKRDLTELKREQAELAAELVGKGFGVDEANREASRRFADRRQDIIDKEKEAQKELTEAKTNQTRVEEEQKRLVKEFNHLIDQRRIAAQEEIRLQQVSKTLADQKLESTKAELGVLKERLGILQKEAGLAGRAGIGDVDKLLKMGDFGQGGRKAAKDGIYPGQDAASKLVSSFYGGQADLDAKLDKIYGKNRGQQAAAAALQSAYRARGVGSTLTPTKAVQDAAFKMISGGDSISNRASVRALIERTKTMQTSGKEAQQITELADAVVSALDAQSEDSQKKEQAMDDLITTFREFKANIRNNAEKGRRAASQLNLTTR